MSLTRLCDRIVDEISTQAKSKSGTHAFLAAGALSPALSILFSHLCHEAKQDSSLYDTYDLLLLDDLAGTEVTGVFSLELPAELRVEARVARGASS